MLSMGNYAAVITLSSVPSARTMRGLLRAIFWVCFPCGILSFVLPIYSKDLGASALQVGVLFSAYSIVPVLVRPFLGPVLDRWGRRPFLLLGLGAYVVAMVVFCLSDTIWMLTVARLVQGMGQAFLWLSAYTIVADVAEDTGRGHDFGLLDEAANRGGIVGTVAGFTIFITLQRVGLESRQVWFWLFAAYTIPALLALWSGWHGAQETKPVVIETRSGPRRPVSGQLLTLMGIVFVSGASSAMVWPLLMIFLQDALHAEVFTLIWAYLPAALISAFLPSRTGRIADRFGRKPPMIAGLLIGALASALMPLLRTIGALIVLWAVESLGYAASVPAQRALVADITGEDRRGTSYGLYTFAYFLGSALGPLAGGWLYDTVSQASPFFLNAAVLCFAAVLVAVLLRDPAKPGKVPRLQANNV